MEIVWKLHRKGVGTVTLELRVYLDLVEREPMFLSKLVNFLTLPSLPVDAVGKGFQGQCCSRAKRGPLSPENV